MSRGELCDVEWRALIGSSLQMLLAQEHEQAWSAVPRSVPVCDVIGVWRPRTSASAWHGMYEVPSNCQKSI